MKVWAIKMSVRMAASNSLCLSVLVCFPTSNIVCCCGGFGAYLKKKKPILPIYSNVPMWSQIIQFDYMSIIRTWFCAVSICLFECVCVNGFHVHRVIGSVLCNHIFNCKVTTDQTCWWLVFKTCFLSTSLPHAHPHVCTHTYTHIDTSVHVHA